MVHVTAAAVVPMLLIAAFFGVFGWATAREHDGSAPFSVVVACLIALGLSAYALVDRHHVWTACSLGVFALVHLLTALRHRNDPPLAHPAEV